MRFWLCLLVFIAQGARADSAWLTIIGDAGDAGAETVQVDANSAVLLDENRLIDVRVSRAGVRTAYDGKPYRSYLSAVVIDCRRLTALHRGLTLYAEPLWKGPARRFEVADPNDRPMEFRSMAVNPRDRIIKAACAIETVKTN
ncbi:MAG: hypothetical protein JWP29_3701 [Rhodoferax sp.]|nr:hypothetical protein [Rhodoferax sp.]